MTTSQVLEDDGSFVSTITAVVHDADRGRLYLHGQSDLSSNPQTTIFTSSLLIRSWNGSPDSLQGVKIRIMGTEHINYEISSVLISHILDNY